MDQILIFDLLPAAKFLCMNCPALKGRIGASLVSCRELIPDLGITLRYYCGYILPR